MIFLSKRWYFGGLNFAGIFESWCIDFTKKIAAVMPYSPDLISKKHPTLHVLYFLLVLMTWKWRNFHTQTRIALLLFKLRKVWIPCLSLMQYIDRFCYFDIVYPMATEQIILTLPAISNKSNEFKMVYVDSNGIPKLRGHSRKKVTVDEKIAMEQLASLVVSFHHS